MKATARQINALVADIRLQLKRATDTAWGRNPGQIERMEEMYVAFLVESAFRKSRMLFETARAEPAGHIKQMFDAPSVPAARG